MQQWRSLMGRTEVLKKLRELKPILKEKYGIEEFAIFGSVARDEARRDSKKYEKIIYLWS